MTASTSPDIATRYERRDQEPSGGISRQDSERDRDRLLYSSAFRRLNGVTQVTAAGEIGLFHNRLTHSLKVGQTARKIGAALRHLCKEDPKIEASCRRFGGAHPSKDQGSPAVDGWVLEAAGMAHDLGHPPFGHIGEAALQRIVSDNPNEMEGGPAVGGRRISALPVIDPGFHLKDGFEGNAQSFRIVTRLAFGSYAVEGVGTGLGLNLTKATLSALCKYPWTRNPMPQGVDPSKEKWGAYESETDMLDWCMSGIRGEPRVGRNGQFEYRSIEAQAMDWADDITYAVHDLEDFCRAGLIPLDDLTSSGQRESVKDFWRYCKPKLLKNPHIAKNVADGRLNLDACLEKARQDLQGAQGTGLPKREGREVLRKWAANRIEHWTGPATVSVDAKNGILDIDDISLVEVEILKKLTWFFVIDRPALASAQRGQAKVLRELFSWLVSWSEESYPGLEDKAKVFASVRRRNYTHGGLPARFLDYLDIAFSFDTYREPRKNIARATLDYISSLTEHQVLDLHARLGGATEAPMLDGWFTV